MLRYGIIKGYFVAKVTQGGEMTKEELKAMLEGEEKQNFTEIALLL